MGSLSIRRGWSVYLTVSEPLSVYMYICLVNIKGRFVLVDFLPWPANTRTVAYSDGLNLLRCMFKNATMFAAPVAHLWPTNEHITWP